MKGKCICALGEFAVNPVVATIKHFRADYELALSPISSPQPGVTNIPASQDDLRKHLTIQRHESGNHHG
jgi:hypothetical protein